MKVKLSYTGYKTVAVVNGVLCSHANKSIQYPNKVGSKLVDSNGIYLANSRKFVLDYYSGLHETEALLTLEYKASDVLKGNVTDMDGEVLVSKCVIKRIEYMEIEE